jgi:hypothetical protein
VLLKARVIDVEEVLKEKKNAKQAEEARKKGWN